jgi:NADH-quinone oxidoreductase subunit H
LAQPGGCARSPWPNGDPVSAISRSLGHVSTAGRIVIPLLVLALVVAPVLVVLLAAFVGPWLGDVLSSNLGIVRFVVAITGVLLFSIPAAFIIIYMELKVIAYMNLRVGPNRVGPGGAAHSVVAGLKVLSKEDFTPTNSDRIVFTWAPVIVFLTAVMTFLVIPFGPGFIDDKTGQRVGGLVGQDLNIGLLYLFAVGGMTVVGLLLAGWSSFNKYSLLGGLRSAAQMVSYEIPLTLSVVGLILLAGTMSLTELAHQQEGWFTSWFVFRQPLGALIFFIAATAEANRTPFDLTEADSEIVAGFATEYSGMRFGFLFFAEYVNVFIVSALITTLFFGAWNAPVNISDVLALVRLQAPVVDLDPGSLGVWLLILAAVVPLLLTLLFALPAFLTRSKMPAWQAVLVGFLLFNVVAMGAAFLLGYIGVLWLAGILWFFIKSFAFVFVFVWMRGTFPRVRIDHLMGFAWKWLLPAALLNLFLTATAIVVVDVISGKAV